MAIPLPVSVFVLQLTVGSLGVVPDGGESAEDATYGEVVVVHRQASADDENSKHDLARAEYRAAAEGYSRFLQRYPAAEHAADAKFYRAEALFRVGDFAGASQHFIEVRDSTPQSAHSEEAAGPAVFAMSYLLSERKQCSELGQNSWLREALAEGAHAKRTAPMPLSGVEAQYLRAIDTYLERFPTGTYAPQLALDATYLLRDHRQFEELRKRLDWEIERFPTDAATKCAVRDRVTLEYVDSDHPGAETEFGNLSTAVCRVAPACDACRSLASEFASLQITAAQELEGRGQVVEACRALDRAVDQQEALRQHQPLRDPALAFECARPLLEAAQCQIKLKKVDGAIERYRRVIFECRDPRWTEYAEGAIRALRFDPHSTHDGGSPRRSIGAGGCMQRESVPLARR
jgi:tetratricopeptide (TPR) repeat protein